LPALSSTDFLRFQTEVAEIVHATAWDEIKKAGEDKSLPIESGSLDVDGTPINYNSGRRRAMVQAKL